jgi:hypothetical protein
MIEDWKLVIDSFNAPYWNYELFFLSFNKLLVCCYLFKSIGLEWTTFLNLWGFPL